MDRLSGEMKPRILDPSFRYTRAVETDIRKTFARERKRLALLKAKQEQNNAEAQAKVKTLKATQDVARLGNAGLGKVR